LFVQHQESAAGGGGTGVPADDELAPARVMVTR
jgi:hypothetical protein